MSLAASLGPSEFVLGNTFVSPTDDSDDAEIEALLLRHEIDDHVEASPVVAQS